MGSKYRKKRGLRSAFSFFIEEYRQLQKSRGRNISMTVAAEECAAQWEVLPKALRRKYEELAEACKADANVGNGRPDFVGMSLAKAEKKQKEQNEKSAMGDLEMRTTICDMNLKELITHNFYIIHCNYYCKTDDDVFLPGELAISEFTLENGIKDTCHILVDPGPIPLGFALDVQKNIDEVNGLPYPPYDEAESNFSVILEEILEFIQPGKLPDGRHPPLFALGSNLQASEKTLELFLQDDQTPKDIFRVYPLHMLFFYLKNKCVEGDEDDCTKFPVMASAETEITKDTYCYTPDISCAYHAVNESLYQNCSLSVVKRYVYLICDHCCHHVGVVMVPGLHCRKNAALVRNKNKFDQTSGGASACQGESASGIQGKQHQEREEDEEEEGEEEKKKEKKKEKEGEEEAFGFLDDELQMKFIDASKFSHEDKSVWKFVKKAKGKGIPESTTRKGSKNCKSHGGERRD